MTNCPTISVSMIDAPGAFSSSLKTREEYLASVMRLPATDVMRGGNIEEARFLIDLYFELQRSMFPNRKSNFSGALDTLAKSAIAAASRVTNRRVTK